MNKQKVKIIDGFKKTSSFGWRFTPKWKRNYISEMGVNSFDVLKKGIDISKEEDRNKVIEKLQKAKYNDNQYSKVFNFHNGVDFVGDDLQLLAIADGKIIEVGTNDLSGHFIKTKHILNGVEFILSYCHLATHTPQILGNKITKGEWIAVMGKTGKTVTGIHCHLTVKIDNGITREIVNPEDFFEFM